MILSSMATMNSGSLLSSCVQSPSFRRQRNLPTPPPSLADVNDSSSCSSSSSSSSSSSTDASVYSISTTTTKSTTPSDIHQTESSADLLNIITDPRFRPVFQAIEEIKRRKCRPDFERILKHIQQKSTEYQKIYHREEILRIIDELFQVGLVKKVFHKGGFTIRIQNQKYARLIEKMTACYNQKTPTAIPMSPQQAMAAALAKGNLQTIDPPWSIPKVQMFNSNEINRHHQPSLLRPTVSQDFTAFKTESSLFSSSSFPFESKLTVEQSQVVKENTCLHPPPSLLTPSTTTLITSPQSTKKRTRIETITPTLLPSTTIPTISTKKPCTNPCRSEIPLFPAPILSMTTKNDDHLFRKPFDRYHQLPPVTIEQLLGLRGDIPDVHNWSIEQLDQFFQQQGFEYASSLLYQYQINGNELYQLKREDVFRKSPLKVGKTLKLWNVIEQIQQRNNRSS